MSEIAILDLKPIGYYYGGRPKYSFHNPFADSTPSVEDGVCSATKETAYQSGSKNCDEYQRQSFPGGMAYCLGVVECKKYPCGEDKCCQGYRAVTVSAYSFS